jgi:hypothetical protein
MNNHVDSISYKYKTLQILGHFPPPADSCPLGRVPPFCCGDMLLVRGHLVNKFYTYILFNLFMDAIFSQICARVFVYLNTMVFRQCNKNSTIIFLTFLKHGRGANVQPFQRYEKGKCPSLQKGRKLPRGEATVWGENVRIPSRPRKTYIIMYIVDNKIIFYIADYKVF